LSEDGDVIETQTKVCPPKVFQQTRSLRVWIRLVFVFYHAFRLLALIHVLILWLLLFAANRAINSFGNPKNLMVVKSICQLLWLIIQLCFQYLAWQKFVFFC